MGFEAIHWMRSRKLGKHGYAALNLDISKAYDRVEWRFLEAMLTKLGFDPIWTTKLMRCVTSVSYSFKVNQNTYGIYHPAEVLERETLFHLFYL